MFIRRARALLAPAFLVVLGLSACDEADVIEGAGAPSPVISEFEPLVDATTPVNEEGIPEGWRNPYDWGSVAVDSGVVSLTADDKFFLVTEDVYSDFIFEGEVLLPDTGAANSGFMFRANVEPNRVYGYQAEVDPTERAWSGGLYDEGRRGWFASPIRDDSASVAAFVSTGNPYQHGEWNRYRIEALGDSLKIYVNGTLRTAVRDTMDREGVIGIQHHGEDGQVYRFRNLRIAEIEGAG